MKSYKAYIGLLYHTTQYPSVPIVPQATFP